MSYQTGDNTNSGTVDARIGSRQLGEQIANLNALEQAAARRAKEAIDAAANTGKEAIVNASGAFFPDGSGHENLSITIEATPAIATVVPPADIQATDDASNA